MALNTPRTVMFLSQRALQQCRHSVGKSARQPAAGRTISSTSLRRDDLDSRDSSASRPSEGIEGVISGQEPRPYGADPRPRWSYTPERMKAPFSINPPPKKPSRQVWQVNADPQKLDRMYERLIGRDLTRLLPEELKFLAVTHKSYDYGRRGYNTRLAFYGRHVITMEATRSILTGPVAEPVPDEFGRQPFRHPALDNVDKLAVKQPKDLIAPHIVAKLGYDVGLPGVMRWKPKTPENLQGAGIDVVMSSTMYAILGAVSLHAGAEVAMKILRERILPKLEAYAAAEAA